MKLEMSPDEMNEFSAKLQDWSSTLSDNERSLLKHMFELDRSRLLTKALNQISGIPTEVRPVTLQAHAPNLNADFFRLMCW